MTVSLTTHNLRTDTGQFTLVLPRNRMNGTLADILQNLGVRKLFPCGVRTIFALVLSTSLNCLGDHIG